jgi:hypothetical protein
MLLADTFEMNTLQTGLRKHSVPILHCCNTLRMGACRYLATTNLLRDHDHDHAACMARFAIAAVTAAEVRQSLACLASSRCEAVTSRVTDAHDMHNSYANEC